MPPFRYALVLSVAWLAEARADSVVVVGGDPATCDFPSIELAIDAAPATGLTTVRLANDRRYANVRLTNAGRSIALQGGFDDCLQARSHSESGMIGDIRTVISAEASFQPADSLRLSNIDLRLTAPLLLRGPLSMVLERSTVRGANGEGVDLVCHAAMLQLRESTLKLRSLPPYSDCALVGDGEVHSER